MPEVEARELCARDTRCCIYLWNGKPAAHDGLASRFNHLYGSMAFGFLPTEALDTRYHEVPGASTTATCLRSS